MINIFILRQKINCRKDKNTSFLEMRSFFSKFKMLKFFLFTKFQIKDHLAPYFKNDLLLTATINFG